MLRPHNGVESNGAVPDKGGVLSKRKELGRLIAYALQYV